MIGEERVRVLRRREVACIMVLFRLNESTRILFELCFVCCVEEPVEQLRVVAV